MCLAVLFRFAKFLYYTQLDQVLHSHQRPVSMTQDVMGRWCVQIHFFSSLVLSLECDAQTLPVMTDEAACPVATGTLHFAV